MNIKTTIITLCVSLPGLFLISGCKNPAGQAQASQAGIKPSVATGNSAVSHRVPGYFFGYNAQMMRGPSWDARGFVEQVKGLHPGLIRYPGGTVASYWDWKTGWLKKDVPLRKEWNSIREENPITIDDLKFACDQTGAKPLFVLNMMTSSLPYQLEMLEYAEKSGLPVEFVELDNEIYLGGSFYVKKYPNGKAYAAEANDWISAIKKRFPGARVAVVGYSVKESDARKNKPNAQRTQNWNRDVLSVIRNADAMTFHVYGGTGLNYMGPFTEPAQDDPDPDESGAVDAKAAAYQSAFDKKESIAYVLSIPFIRWKSSEAYDYRLLPEGMRAWITEYNLFEREGVVAGTWAHGLYALMQSLLFLENRKTELICYHNLTTNAQFAAIFNSEKSFYRSVKQKPSQLYGYSAAGYCLQLAGKAMEGGADAVKLDFSNGTTISAARGKAYPALNGWKFQGNKKQRILVTNLSPNGIQVDFSKVISGAPVFTQLHADAHRQIAQPGDLKKQEGKGTLINLAPYSVTLIETD